jgi:uncharacterized protein (DUF433 family)
MADEPKKRELAMQQSPLERIVLNPNVMVGKPVIRGTRIPVELVVRMVGQGIPEEEILREHPRLTTEDIRAALTYAAAVVAREDVFPILAP